MSRTHCLRNKNLDKRKYKVHATYSDMFRYPNTQNDTVLGRIKNGTRPMWSSNGSGDEPESSSLPYARISGRLRNWEDSEAGSRVWYWVVDDGGLNMVAEWLIEWMMMVGLDHEVEWLWWSEWQEVATEVLDHEVEWRWEMVMLATRPRGRVMYRVSRSSD